MCWIRPLSHFTPVIEDDLGVNVNADEGLLRIEEIRCPPLSYFIPAAFGGSGENVDEGLLKIE